MDPRMTATALARIINDINGKYLTGLCGESPDERRASRHAPPSGKTICGDAGCFGGVASSPCFCGITNHGYHTGEDLEDVIVLRDPLSNQPKGKIAVVTTIDDATKPNGEDKELPIVLAVGINYGQMGGFDYLANPLPLWDHGDASEARSGRGCDCTMFRKPLCTPGVSKRVSFGGDQFLPLDNAASLELLPVQCHRRNAAHRLPRVPRTVCPYRRYLPEVRCQTSGLGVSRSK